MQARVHASWLSLVLGPALVLACTSDDLEQGDRSPELLEPLDLDLDGDGERFLGAIEFSRGRLDQRHIRPTPLVPARAGLDASPVIVEFETEGLAGIHGRLGLLPPRAAARQEVAFEIPGQPDDRRSVWIDVEIGVDGLQRFELPPPGPDWHAEWAVVVLELDTGTRTVPVLSGPRSEMLSDGTRAAGGRAVLGVVPVARRPARVLAARLGPAEQVELDGLLDETIWDREPDTLLHSRTGEPADDIDAKLGGRSQVWFAWDDEHLYVAASLPDFDLYAPQLANDDPLYREEAFELFLAGDARGQRYLEQQVSARNVVFDAYFAKYRKGDEAWDGRWRSAVQIDGDLDQPGGDWGWTVELAFPWVELCKKTTIDCPPEPGDQLRVNAFRLDKPDRKTQVGLALSPTLEPDFHAWDNAAELVLSD